MRKKLGILTAGLVAGMMFFGFCLSQGFAKDVELIGAGATFPYPLYSKMFNAYYREFGVKVNYQSIGSGGGIRQLLNKTVDFGATDAFMSDEEIKTKDNYILHIPTCLGAVAVAYNLPGNPQIKFTPEIIADIFLGKIKKWNDPRILAVNPGVNLPGMNIMVVHRSDGSGTTFVFSDYLSKISKEWEKRVGKGKALNWPTGLGAKGNEGVSGLIKQIPGTCGYVELTYALQNNMIFGIIKNKSGNFIKPSIESVNLAAAGIKIPSHTRISITDTEAEYGYPISSFTWLIFYKEQGYAGREKRKATELVKLLWWVVHEGQRFCEPLHYAPLPKNVVEKAESIIKSVVYKGEPVFAR